MGTFTFADTVNDNDVVTFARNQINPQSKMARRTIIDLFLDSAVEYDTPYTFEDAELVDFVDALIGADTT